jgi:hypothetical protein
VSTFGGGVDPEWLERTAAQIRQMASDVDPALRASQYARMVVGKQLAILRWAVAEDLFMQEDYVRISELVHRLIAARRTVVGVGTAQLAKPAIEAKGRLTTHTLSAQFALMPCGQRLAVVVVGLSVLLALDLPPDVRDYVAYLIAVLSAALWLVTKVTNS